MPRYLRHQAAKDYLKTVIKAQNNGEQFIHPTIEGPTMGYFEEDGRYTAFDNRTYECWVEVFEKEDLGLLIDWLNGRLEMSDIDLIDE